ncbi:DNA polymerase III subunit gamma and tau [Actinoallomurus iriomotensis]|uniref:DNA polymerase III subunit gamma and tau n=1 Tax=Actinoallomurus iriomotensis TaxID=478107 RepID=UPI0025556CC9|nr:DNA polymerase III subunit gamma and tau [Actinoallomurus iriomotensis]
MSLALYRKYRPATFAELKGQEHVAEPLQQALRNGRIHHAYLFSGPRGCGKTSSARILARSLNCEQGPTPEPCGKCESCVALGPSGAGHIDVIEIDAASHGGVDDARDLRERAFFAPVAARYKIYIIDEAHMVTREGFNALLKLVEEPPAHLKFIFATTEPEKVIGTIRSRTHHYPFRLIPPGTLRELLEDILQKENVPYEPAAIPLVVRAGAGSARDSESILDQLLAGAGEEGITYARAVSLLGYTDATLLDEVVDAIATRDGGAVFAAIDRVMEGGQDPRRFAADLLERFRDLVILSNVPDSGATGLLDVPPDELERMQAQASRLGVAELTRAADLLHTGLTEMRGATAPRLLLELICARILLPGAYDDEASLLTRLDRLERRLAIGDGAPPADLPPIRRPQPPQPAEERHAPGRAPRSDPAPGSENQPPPVRQPPPAQGGDPTSIVQRGIGGAEGTRGAVDNSAAASSGSASEPSAPAGSVRSAGSDPSGPAGSNSADSGSRSAAPAADSAPPAASPEPPAGPPSVASAAASWGAPSASPGQQASTGRDESRSDRSGQAGRPSERNGSRAASDADWPAPAQPRPQAPQQTQASAQQGDPGTVDVGAIRRMWVDILEAVKQRSKVAWIVLMEGVEVASLDGNVLTLAFANEGKRRGFTTGGKEVVLREALKEILGVEWRIDAVLDNGGGGGRQGPPQPPPDTGGGWGASAPAQPPPPPPRQQEHRPPEPPPTAPAPSGFVPPPPGPMDEADEVDPEGDADAGADSALTGMALIEQVLGGKVIQEIDNA